MAQGFKRTGNSFSVKKAAAASSSSSSSNSTKIRKGARIIAPKKTAAMAKANLTHKLTAQLNRRAESALITRLGSNREGTLKLVRPDAHIVEELRAKKAKKDIGRNNKVPAVTIGKKESGVPTEKSESINSLTKSALQHLNEQETFEAPDSDLEDEEVDEE